MASTPDSVSSPFADQFQQIREKFILGLAKREIEIGGARSPEDLNAMLHKLAGAAGGFGFEELSQLARKTMESCGDDNEEEGQLLKNIEKIRHAMRIIRRAD